MKNWRERLTGPDGNVLKPRTLAEVYGKDRVLVEQHRGLVSYETDAIIFRMQRGEVHLTGEGMVIASFGALDAKVEGKIRGIRLEVHP